MSLSDQDRTRLQQLMETDPDAAFKFHAEKSAEAERAAQAPVARSPLVLSAPLGTGKAGAVAAAAKEMNVRQGFAAEAGLKAALELLKAHDANEDGPKPIFLIGGDGTNFHHLMSDVHYGMPYPGDAVEGRESLSDVLVRYRMTDSLTRVRPPDFGRLAAFVRRETRHADRAEMMLGLVHRLYARMGADGSYQLSPVSCINSLADAIETLREFSDEPFKKMIFVNDDDLVRRQPWMTDKEHFECALDALDSACDASFGESVYDISIGRVVDETGRLVASGTQAAVVESLGSFLNGPMSDRAVASLLKQALTLAAHCAITDDDLNTERCARLLRLLDGALPFGTRESEPGTWFVRVGK